MLDIAGYLLGGGPLLFHCTSGKDRTGWESYVLLRALGVPDATAQQDYLASNGFRAAADAALRAGLKQSGMMQNPDLLIPLQEVRLDYLDAALAQLSSQYGDLYGYLTQGLGLTLGDLAALRSRLVISVPAMVTEPLSADIVPPGFDRRAPGPGRPGRGTGRPGPATGWCYHATGWLAPRPRALSGPARG